MIPPAKAAASTGSPRSSAVVAPDVAARIVARRAAGEMVADIGRDLGMTPTEVLSVLRAASVLGGGPAG